MDKDKFAQLSNLFLGLHAPFPVAVNRLLDSFEAARELVMAAYVVRGELESPAKMGTERWQGLVSGDSLDEAGLHNGEQRADYWVESLADGLEGGDLLAEMLAQVQSNGAGLNTDPTNIRFRQEMADLLVAEVDVLEDPGQLLAAAQSLRLQAAFTVAEPLNAEQVADRPGFHWYSLVDEVNALAGRSGENFQATQYYLLEGVVEARVDEAPVDLVGLSGQWPLQLDAGADSAAVSDQTGDRIAAVAPLFFADGEIELDSGSELRLTAAQLYDLGSSSRLEADYSFAAADPVSLARRVSGAGDLSVLIDQPYTSFYWDIRLGAGGSNSTLTLDFAADSAGFADYGAADGSGDPEGGGQALELAPSSRLTGVSELVLEGGVLDISHLNDDGAHFDGFDRVEFDKGLVLRLDQAERIRTEISGSGYLHVEIEAGYSFEEISDIQQRLREITAEQIQIEAGVSEAVAEIDYWLPVGEGESVVDSAQREGAEVFGVDMTAVQSEGAVSGVEFVDFSDRFALLLAFAGGVTVNVADLAELDGVVGVGGREVFVQPVDAFDDRYEIYTLWGGDSLGDQALIELRLQGVVDPEQLAGLERLDSTVQTVAGEGEIDLLPSIARYPTWTPQHGSGLRVERSRVEGVAEDGGVLRVSLNHAGHVDILRGAFLEYQIADGDTVSQGGYDWFREELFGAQPHAQLSRVVSSGQAGERVAFEAWLGHEGKVQGGQLPEATVIISQDSREFTSSIDLSPWRAREKADLEVYVPSLWEPGRVDFELSLELGGGDSLTEQGYFALYEDTQERGLTWQFSDPRQEALDGIGVVTTQLDSGGKEGTGFLVTPKHVITSAHVVSAANMQADFSGVEAVSFALADDGYFTRDGQDRGVGVEHLEMQTESWESGWPNGDLAILRLEEPIVDAPVLEPFWNAPDEGKRELSGEAVRWAGYPSKGIEQGDEDDLYRWEAGGAITDYLSGGLSLSDSAMAVGGASGSPLLFERDSEPVAVGVYAGSRGDGNAAAPVANGFDQQTFDWALSVIQQDGCLADMEFAVAEHPRNEWGPGYSLSGLSGYAHVGASPAASDYAPAQRLLGEGVYMADAVEAEAWG